LVYRRGTELRDIVNMNDLGWKRDRYTKRGVIKGGTKGGRPSKNEYVQALLRQDEIILPEIELDTSYSKSPEVEEKEYATPNQEPIVTSKIEKEELENVQSYIDKAQAVIAQEEPSYEQAKFDIKYDVPVSKSRFTYYQNHHIIAPKQYPKFPSNEKGRNNTIKRNKYINEGKIPFLYSSAHKQTYMRSPTTEIVPIPLFSDLPEVDILQEKKYDVDTTGKTVNSTKGQNIQAVFDNNMELKGLWTQQSAKDDPIPNFAKAKEIWVDQDDTGHYIAYLNNLYAFDDPLRKNVRFHTSSGLEPSFDQEPTHINEAKALRFLAKNYVNSAAYRRNLRVSSPVIKNIIGEEALTYRTTEGNNKTFDLGEQKLAICYFIFEPTVTLLVKTHDTTISFDDHIPEDINIKETDNPKLYFIPDSNQKITLLTSDAMIKLMVQNLDLEPDQSQRTLEQLYWSKWINYPRSDTRKAEFEPIYPLKDYREYKGSLQEKQVLKIVHEANEAYKQGKNYTETGTWFLHHKGEIMAQKIGIKTPEILAEYDRDSYDIRVIRDGKTKHDIVNFIEDNDIGTPATRMNQWENLIQAGMIKKVGDLYTVDTRGIVMASTYEWYTKNTWNALDMMR